MAQDPVLFSSTIRDNIIFGDREASDAKVRQYAEMANALEFIESNYEELNEYKRIDKMRAWLRDVSAVRQKDKYFKKATAERVSKLSMISDLTVLKILKETIENMDEKFQDWLEENTEFFCKIVNEELLNKEAAKKIGWDTLIIRCEWKKELLG